MTVERIKNWVPPMGNYVEDIADWIQRHYQDHNEESVSRIQDFSEHTSVTDMNDLDNTALSDPNADRMVFWDDSDGQYEWLVPNSLLSITDNNLNVDEGSIDHDNLTNTHNLTTDIDHDATTNFVANKHIDWTDTSSNFKTSGTVITRDPIVDVRSYGAVGDGVTDDTTALNNAFAAGGQIFIPDGTYLVTGSGDQCLSALVSNTRIVGESMGGTIIKLDDGQTVNNILSTYESPASEKYRMQFENFTIDGNKANQSGVQTMHGLRIDDCTYVSVKRVYVKDVYTDDPMDTEAGGIVAIDSWDVILDECMVTGVVGYGIFMGNVGVDFIRGVLKGCIVTACNSGINCWNVRNMVVTGCHSYANDTYGIVFEDCFNIAIVGCSSYLNGSVGFWLNETSDSIISSNLSYNNDAHGIYVAGTDGYKADDNIIIGNRSGDTRGSKSQDYGIYEGTYADGNLYALNNIKDNVAAPIYLTSATSKCFNNITDESVDVASAGTVTLPNTGEYFNITGTTNVTSVTASWAGRRVVLKFAGILTFTDGSNLKLAGNFVTTADDTISLVSDGTNWYEISRSVN